jgi:hypothetical protein
VDSWEHNQGEKYLVYFKLLKDVLKQFVSALLSPVLKQRLLEEQSKNKARF